VSDATDGYIKRYNIKNTATIIITLFLFITKLILLPIKIYCTYRPGNTRKHIFK